MSLALRLPQPLHCARCGGSQPEDGAAEVPTAASEAASETIGGTDSRAPDVTVTVTVTMTLTVTVTVSREPCDSDCDTCYCSKTSLASTRKRDL